MQTMGAALVNRFQCQGVHWEDLGSVLGHDADLDALVRRTRQVRELCTLYCWPARTACTGHGR
jgi:hypothetical protein